MSDSSIQPPDDPEPPLTSVADIPKYVKWAQRTGRSHKLSDENPLGNVRFVEVPTFPLQPLIKLGWAALVFAIVVFLWAAMTMRYTYYSRDGIVFSRLDHWTGRFSVCMERAELQNGQVTNWNCVRWR